MFRNESMEHLEATGAAALEFSDQGMRKFETTFLTASGREASSQTPGRLAKQRTAGEAGKPVCCWQLAAGGRLQSPSHRVIPRQARASNRAVPE